MRTLVLVVVLAGALGAGCTKQTPDPLPRHAEGAAPPPSVSAPPAPGPTPTATPTSTPTQAAAPTPTTSPTATPDASADAAPVHVKIATIGMHVGGGPYDEPTKEPMKRSVEPRFPDLARCWPHVTKPQPTDVGVDLVIEAAGGRAKVSNPRTTAVGEGFVPCVVAFFESVDFQRPKNGKAVVSYSVRFTP